MPGGYGNIKGYEGNKFSSTNQPKNRGNKKIKILTDLLKSELEAGEQDITIEGTDVQTGERRKIIVRMPTKKAIIAALLRKGAKGNMAAIREILDRTEGKVPQKVETPPTDPLTIRVIRDSNV